MTKNLLTTLGIKMVLVSAFFIGATGCGTTPSQSTLTPQQRKQIQEMDVTLARWRIQDYYAYYGREYGVQR